MKKVYLFMPFLFTNLFALLTFFAVNPLSAQDIADAKKPVENPGTVFVQMNDGSIRNFSTLKMVTGIMKTPHLVADGKHIINGNEIRAYQDNDNHYAVSQKVFESGRRTHLALDILPGFVQRITSGKLSIYCKRSFNGYRVITEFFIQSGTVGAILPYSESLLNDLVKDDPQALKILNSKVTKQSLLEKLQLTSIIVNGAGPVSKN